MSHEPWLVDPLGYLIGAGREDDFFSRVYEREALVVHHGAPERFAGLISLDVPGMTFVVVAQSLWYCLLGLWVVRTSPDVTTTTSHDDGQRV